MEKEEVKATAIKWLNEGFNSAAMRVWIDCHKSHAEWEREILAEGRAPNRQGTHITYHAKMNGMAQIIDIYLTGWLDDRGLSVHYKVKQDIFTMAHQLLTGKEPWPK